jgi:hypothetical protein
MPAIVTRQTIAEASGDPEDIKRVIEDWQDAALAFWSTTGDKRPLQKLHRGSVWRWLAATWTMLRSITGFGWDHWRLPKPELRHEDATKWPCISVVSDQGGDGWSAAYMLSDWGCNIISLFDVNHRTWNDCCLALRDAGVYSWVLVSLVLMGLDHGPWSSSRWWADLKESAREYCAVSNGSCPIFSLLWHQIAEESQIDQSSLDVADQEKERVFQNIGDAVSHKYEKIGMARWFGYAGAVDGLLKTWSTRLCILLYYLIMTGNNLKGLQDFVALGGLFASTFSPSCIYKMLMICGIPLEE